MTKFKKKISSKLVAASAVSGRFSNWREFSGGLATVFPGTAVVESNFSALKYKKNSFRTSLLDLTLEGIMHSKQYNVLFELLCRLSKINKNKNLDDPK